MKGDKTRVELLPAFKFTGKLVKIKEFTGKCLFNFIGYYYILVQVPYDPAVIH